MKSIGYQSGTHHDIRAAIHMAGPIAADTANEHVVALLQDPEVVEVILIVDRNGPGSLKGINVYSRLEEDEKEAKLARAAISKARDGR